MSSLATAAMVVTGVAAVAGAGYSIYSSEQASSANKKAAGQQQASGVQQQAAANASADAQRAAGKVNQTLAQRQADATNDVSQFQSRLNLASAKAQSSQEDQNASAYHYAARATEGQGFQQEINEQMDAARINSSARASYAASGVTSDSGSPLVTAAYNAGQQQLQRMNTGYKATVDAMGQDWQGALQSYQSQLTQETAKQYQYASDMSEWTKNAAYTGAAVQRWQTDNGAAATANQGLTAFNQQMVGAQVSNSQAQIAQMQGISAAISGVGSAASTMGSAARYSTRTPTVSAAAGTASTKYPVIIGTQ